MTSPHPGPPDALARCGPDRHIGTRTADQGAQLLDVGLLSFGPRHAQIRIAAQRQHHDLLPVKTHAALAQRQPRQVAHLHFPLVRGPVRGNTKSDDDTRGTLRVVTRHRNSRDDRTRRVLADHLHGRHILEETFERGAERLGDVFRFAAQHRWQLGAIDLRAELTEAIVERHGRSRFGVRQLIDALQGRHGPWAGHTVFRPHRLAGPTADRRISADDDAVWRNEDANQRGKQEREACSHRSSS